MNNSIKKTATVSTKNLCQAEKRLELGFFGTEYVKKAIGYQ